ncbi:MAG: hypothetical protein ACUVWR_15810 [Anaerolineae bacterium]
MSKKVLVRSLVCLLLVASLAAIYLPAAAQTESAAALVTSEIGTVGISSPVSGSTISGEVEIKGTATSNKFWYYKVEYSVDGTNWVSVDTDYQHKTAVSEDVLASWDTTTVANGTFWLRAVVVDNTGNWLASEPIQVVVANAVAAPEAEATVEATATEAAAAVATEAVAVTVEDVAKMSEEELTAFLTETLPGLLPASLSDMEKATLIQYATAALSTLASNERGTVGLFSPIEGATVSGSVDIVGTATANAFSWYKVEYSADGSNWVSVDTDYQHKTAMNLGTLATWDTTAVANGAFWLRAVVVDNTGNWVASNPVQVTVANAAAEAVATVEAVATEEATATPEATATAEAAAPAVAPAIGTVVITAPKAGEVLTGSATISGTATAANLAYYKVEYSVDGSNWVTVDTDYQHKTAVSDGVLATWDTTAVADGAYWLRAAIVDNTGNWLGSEPVMVTVSNAAAS